ncbi:hypothetical protein GF362_04150 [Candidatus Dojkabacteria bacterium]|nr:hypothetical protein [Candidatus Dojkabacteria bacterium]
MIPLLRYFLFIWIFINILFVSLSFYRVRNSGKKVGWIWWWAGILGAFVWEDLLVFSFYNIIAANLVLVLDDFRYAVVLTLVFWVVRSLGEALYNFLQQFNQPTMYPHNQFLWDDLKIFKKVFGNISNQKVFFILQITMQITTVFSLFFLIYTFLHWEAIGNIVNI